MQQYAQEAIEMDRDEFIMSCIGCGLDVTKMGLIKDDDYEYGFIKSKNLTTCLGEEYPLNRISEISYIDIEHTLVIRSGNGESKTIVGTELSEVDASRALRQMLMPSCLMELDAVMDVLFPGLEDKPFFDILNEQMAF